MAFQLQVQLVAWPVVVLVLKVLQLLVGLAVVEQVEVLTLQEQVVEAAMAASHLAAVEEEEQVLQLVAQVVRVRQVKLEFGAGNDIKQYYTIT